MLKDDIKNYLAEHTVTFYSEEDKQYFTTIYMSKYFSVKRNTISHYLNQLVDEGKVIKVNTRPVYFLDKQTFVTNFHPVSKQVFMSLAELETEKEKLVSENSNFKGLIGEDSSLKKVIEQIKTSVFYPDKGLPIMLYGPTGTGKSMLAFLIWQYSVKKKVLPKDAPFLAFNCAQYANNPELLSSNLFGHVRGAFTGANETRSGILEKANGGILFLDEVHRLNEESQEKLFTFLDRGVFRRMGESESEHTSNVRLIFATTENPKTHFLQTFIRRIPLNVYIPSLDERGEYEKLLFVYSFLLKEAQVLNREILLSSMTLRVLSSYSYKGNIGELQNVIKYICAAAFSKNREKDLLEIRLHDIPETMFSEEDIESEKNYGQNKMIQISPNMTVNQLCTHEISEISLIRYMFEQFCELYNNKYTKKIQHEVFESNINNEINVLLDKLIFERVSEQESSFMRYTVSALQSIFRYVENSHFLQYNGNNLYAIAYYFYFRNQHQFYWTEKEQKELKGLYKYIKQHAYEENMIAKRMVKLIENKLDTSLELEDEIFLSFYLKGIRVCKGNKQVKAIILAHGYATASSIASVTNRMLGRNVFESFDMPLDIQVKEVAAKVMQYIKRNDVSQGLIILVDMGSLIDIYSQFTKALEAPVAIINNVSTQLALNVGELIQKEVYLEEIIEAVKTYQETKYKLIYPKIAKQRAIVTSCFTGMGTALQLKKLLEDSIPVELNIKMIAHDYERLKTHGTREALFQMYDIMTIVGTADPNVKEVSYISIDDMISGRGEEKLRKVFNGIADEEMIQNINNNLVRNFSLERVIDSLTILDTTKIIKQVGECIDLLEIQMKQRIANDRKVGLYIHCSCMVERLIRQIPMENYHNIDVFKKCRKNAIKTIQTAFSVIEKTYNVKMTIEEVGYIFDIITAGNDKFDDF